MIMKKVGNIYGILPWIWKSTFFILAIGLIVWIFPREGKFKYTYAVGQPWHYEDLFAPFDFAILKSGEALAAEKEEVLRETMPIFRLDKARQTESIQVFNSEFSALYTAAETRKDSLSITGALRVFISRFDSVYSHGVIMVPQSLDSAGFSRFRLITEDRIEEMDISQVFTLGQAWNYLSSNTGNMSRELSQSGLALARKHLSYNIIYDKERTEIDFESRVAGLSETQGLVRENERIISKGEILSPGRFQVLESLRREHQGGILNTSAYYLVLAGQVILVSMAFLMLFLFLWSFRRDLLENNRTLLLNLLLITIMVLAAAITARFDSRYLYAVPLCLVPVIVRSFFDTRLALFVHLISIVLVSFLVPSSFVFLFLQLIAGIVTVVSMAELDRRSKFFSVAGFILLTYSLTYVGITLIQDGSLSSLRAENFGLFAMNALLVMLAYPLIFLFERLFHLVTAVTLIELSDTNQPLLRELATLAPGTFQHSVQVGNLAETAIHRIGGNALLARTGALYHDIGKTDIPLYFIENQAGGVNPHEGLSYEESARIIISHVSRGIEKAKKHRIPESIVDFIRTHHGTRTVDYFLRMHRKEEPDTEIDMTDFSYPGPAPFSRETAVVMMADSVEAASRSLRRPDAEQVNQLVEKIIDKQIVEGQFDNTDITLKDFHVIKDIFKMKLQAIFHLRITYPE